MAFEMAPTIDRNCDFPCNVCKHREDPECKGCVLHTLMGDPSELYEAINEVMKKKNQEIKDYEALMERARSEYEQACAG